MPHFKIFQVSHLPGNNMKMQGIRVYQTFLRFLPYEIRDSIALLLRSSTKITNKKFKYSTIIARKATKTVWINT